MNNFTERHQNICIYGGIFGAMLAATCLIQHISLSGSHWVSFTLLGVYVYAIKAFIVLSLQKKWAPVILIISSALIMIALVFVLVIGFYSLALILLFLYSLVMTIVIYMEQLPSRLKEKAQLKRQEELAWKGKL